MLLPSCLDLWLFGCYFGLLGLLWLLLFGVMILFLLRLRVACLPWGLIGRDLVAWVCCCFLIWLVMVDCFDYEFDFVGY